LWLLAGCTVGDLRGAATQLYGLEAEDIILVKAGVHAVDEFTMTDDTTIRDSRPGEKRREIAPVAAPFYAVLCCANTIFLPRQALTTIQT
jgi:hypothetical protein